MPALPKGEEFQMPVTTLPTRTYARNQKRIAVTLGFDEGFAARNNQSPYFSVTADLFERCNPKGRFYNVGGGAAHDEIRAAFKKVPLITNLLRWHLCDVNGIPMHYVANALYWRDVLVGELRDVNPSDPVATFAKHVVLGSVIGDPDPVKQVDVRLCMERPDLEAWLTSRLPELRAVMLFDMERAGVLVPAVTETKAA